MTDSTVVSQPSTARPDASQAVSPEAVFTRPDGSPPSVALPTPVDGGEPLRIAVISGSVRDQRMGRTLAEWAAFRAAATPAEVDLIDCADCLLPGDEELLPGGSSGSPVAARLQAADAYVIVTPEYNHSYPASLKRLIDWHYREWMFKPATVLSYGVQGGLLAVEHLRGVFAELHMVTTRRVVGLRQPWNDLGPAGYTAPSDVTEAFDSALRELEWWAGVLRTARRDRPFAR